MVTFSEIIKALPSLSVMEMQEVKRRLNFLLKGEQKKDENDAELILLVIYQVCTDCGIDVRFPYLLKRVIGYPTFKEKSKEVVKILGKGLTQAELISILSIGLYYLINQLRNMKISVSASVLMDHIYRLPGILDINFPGYVEAGLIKLVVGERK